MEKLFLVIERIPGYYDEPDAYELKGFFTTPEAVAELKVSTGMFHNEDKKTFNIGC